MENEAKKTGQYGSYFQSMRNFFHNQVVSTGQTPLPIIATDKAVNGIPDFGKNINTALRLGQAPVETPPEPEYDRYVRIINVSNAELEADLNACKSLTLDNLPTGSKCGWLYIPDSASQPQDSIALVGTMEGPNKNIQIGGKPVDLSNGREWFWNDRIADAKKKELEKECKRIKFCNGIVNNGPCAFDVNQKHGVPNDNTVPNPNPLQNITDVTKCPSNFSFCTDNDTQVKRRGCVTVLLDMEGIRKEGWLYTSAITGWLGFIHDRAKTPTTLQITAEELAGEAGKSPTDYAGFKSFRTKLQYWKRLATSYDKVVSDIAQMAVYGKLSGDRQYIEDNYVKTILTQNTPGAESLAVEMLQKMWRKEGCQPAGSGYPTSTAGISGKSVVEIKQEYQNLYRSMFDAENDRLQSEAIRKCLNASTSVYTGAPAPSAETTSYCNERGMEYFVFDGVGATAILLGRFFSNVGLLVDPLFRQTPYKVANDIQTRINDADRYPKVSYKVRTMVSVEKNVTMNPSDEWKPPYTSKYVVQVNKVTQPGLVVTLPANSRNLLEITYEGRKDDVGGWGAPKYPYMDLNLDKFQLYQSSTKPLVSLGFFKNTYLDFNRAAALDNTRELQLRTVGSPARMGLSWSVPEPTDDVKLTPSIRRNVMEVISQRLWISDTSLPITLYRLQDSTTVNFVETAEIVVTVANPEFRYTVKNGFELKEATIPLTGAVVFKEWMTLAVRFRMTVLGTLGITVYVNNREKGSASIVLSGEGFRRPMDVYLMNRTFNMDSAMGWFHIYDRAEMVGAIEGFQVGSSLAILNQEETGYDPMGRPPLVRAPLPATRPSYMVREVPNYTGDSAEDLSSGPSSGPIIGSGTCPFETKRGNNTSVNYNTDAYYGQAFAVPATAGIRTNNITNARACEDLCTGDCIGYTFNAAANGSCTTYTDLDLGKVLVTKADPSSFSVITRSTANNFSYRELKAQTLQAITNYKQMKKAFEEKGLVDKLFYNRPTAGESIFTNLFGASAPSTSVPASFTRIMNPRSDAEIAADEESVRKDLYSLDCLNGIKTKYSFE